MMLTNFLPNGGNGTFTINAVATDIDGHQVTLGSKTVTVDNASAVKPFGAIDTPTQGGGASGSQYTNWGWVLTPQPNSIPTDGSTLSVYVDSVNLGHPAYNINRSDIAALFPGYANSNGAAGYFILDTTAYEDGVHTIQWVATDSAGNTAGIGSRYFIIQNSSPDTTGSTSLGYPAVVKTLGSVPLRLDGEFPLAVNDWGPVEIKLGYEGEIHGVPILKDPDENGLIRVEIKELERVEVDFNFGSSQVSGGMLVGNRLRSLPHGSTLFPRQGIFCWQAAPGYLGSYRLIFIGADQYGNKLRKDILARVIPQN
jgi:hypothetical protein